MKIYLTPRWAIFIPSVTFEPLCTLNFMQIIRKKIILSLLGHFKKLSKQSILGHFGSFFEQTTFFGKITALSLLSVYGTLTSYKKKKSEKLMAQFWEIIKNVIFRAFFFYTFCHFLGKRESSRKIQLCHF